MLSSVFVGTLVGPTSRCLRIARNSLSLTSPSLLSRDTRPISVDPFNAIAGSSHRPIQVVCVITMPDRFGVVPYCRVFIETGGHVQSIHHSSVIELQTPPQIGFPPTEDHFEPFFF